MQTTHLVTANHTTCRWKTPFHHAFLCPLGKNKLYMSCRIASTALHLQISGYIQKELPNSPSKSLQYISHEKLHIIEHSETLEGQGTQLRKILDVVNQNLTPDLHFK
jgi:hypothetical protein